MFFRFLLLVLVVGGAFSYFRFVADESVKTQFKDTVAQVVERVTNKAEKTQETILEQKDILQSTLQDLQKQAEEKTGQGIEKYEEITTRIQETKSAIEELDASLKALKASVGLEEKDSE